MNSPRARRHPGKDHQFLEYDVRLRDASFILDQHVFHSVIVIRRGTEADIYLVFENERNSIAVIPPAEPQ